MYRLPNRTVYAAMISKIFIAMNRKMGRNAGETLDKLEVEAYGLSLGSV